MSSHETRLRVRYAETDQMGIVYHANYLIWMEVGRVEYCRAAGMRYRDLEAEGINLAVVEAECRYLKPALYDQEIAIVTTLAEASPRMLEFRYATSDRFEKALTAHIKSINLRATVDFNYHGNPPFSFGSGLAVSACASRCDSASPPNDVDKK